MNVFELAALAICVLTMCFHARRLYRLREAPVGSGELDEFTHPRRSRRPGNRLPLSGWLRTLNVNINPLAFALGLTMPALLVFNLVLTLWPEQLPAAVMTAAAMMIVSFHAISDMASARIRRLERGLVESLDLMRATFDTGMPPRQAILVASSTAKGPLKKELTEIVARLDAGNTAEQAVARIASRYRCPGTQLFAQALIARYQSDTNFSSILASVSRIMHERIRQQMAIDTQLSGTRYAAILCGLLPYILVPVFIWQYPQWLDTLTLHPRGSFYLGGALLSQVCGFLWLRHILRTWR